LEDLEGADDLAGQMDKIFLLVDCHLLFLLITVGLFLDSVGELSGMNLTIALGSTTELALKTTTTSHTLLEGLFHCSVDIIIPICFISIDKNEVAEVASHLADLVH
jgi:hypothetical protein